MKAVANMTETEKEQIRNESIRNAVTNDAIAAFDGPFETAVRDFPRKPSSGLIEQQRLFKLARLRKKHAHRTPPLAVI